MRKKTTTTVIILMILLKPKLKIRKFILSPSFFLFF